MHLPIYPWWISYFFPNDNQSITTYIVSLVCLQIVELFEGILCHFYCICRSSSTSWTPLWSKQQDYEKSWTKWQISHKAALLNVFRNVELWRIVFFINRHETAINEIYCVENGIVVSFFFHVVLPLTISSFLASPSTCRRCVYLSVPLSKDPKSPPPLRISDAKENPFSRLISLSSIMSTSLRIPSSSGSHSDWTISELPHSLLYSNMILESWWDSKTWSGIVCNRQMKKCQNLNGLGFFPSWTRISS